MRRRYSVPDKKGLGTGLRHPPVVSAYSTQILEMDDVESINST
jgi:hypothetical protein